MEIGRDCEYNLLAALEKEQETKADMFRSSNTCQFSEYRKQCRKMPHIVVIMDNFQSLFSYDNEVNKKYAAALEKISERTKLKEKIYV